MLNARHMICHTILEQYSKPPLVHIHIPNCLRTGVLTYVYVHLKLVTTLTLQFFHHIFLSSLRELTRNWDELSAKFSGMVSNKNYYNYYAQTTAFYHTVACCVHKRKTIQTQNFILVKGNKKNEAKKKTLRVYMTCQSVYPDIWEVAVSKDLACEKEQTNQTITMQLPW